MLFIHNAIMITAPICDLHCTAPLPSPFNRGSKNRRDVVAAPYAETESLKLCQTKRWRWNHRDGFVEI